MAKCLNFFYKQDGTPCPCGKCAACYARRASAWSFRLMQEEKSSINAHFITLTYDRLHLNRSKANLPTLSKRDCQLFYKRLRKLHSKKGSNLPPLRYYHVGEYGGKTWRPHYHAIIFNCDLKLIQSAWTCPITKSHIGEIHYGTVTGASAGYCLKYMSKVSRIPRFKGDDRQPEFALMSKGLGKSYLTPQMIRYHLNDPYNKLYCSLPDGIKLSMPRYYKQKIYDQSLLEEIYYHLAKQHETPMTTIPTYESILEEQHNQIQLLNATNQRVAWKHLTTQKL